MPSRINDGGSNTKAANETDNARFSATTFANPDLDPVEYLNSTLPRLAISTSSSQPGASSLAEVSSSTQTLLSQLGSHSAQLSANLTQLTDDILRSGSRLAYEVEVLRGDTIGLHDSLTDRLQPEVSIFKGADVSEKAVKEGQDDDSTEPVLNETVQTQPKEPEFVEKLRMFNQVKARLEEVISAFGEAMEWPLAPSEVSIASSFISVSAPDPGSDTQSQEEKGREVANRLRSEVQSLLSSSRLDISNLHAAAHRVEHLRNLALIWKGTAEEKARVKFVDSLGKSVDEKRRAAGLDDTKAGSSSRPSDSTGNSRTSTTNDTSSSKGGLFRNLQRLRDEIYLE